MQTERRILNGTADLTELSIAKNLVPRMELMQEDDYNIAIDKFFSNWDDPKKGVVNANCQVHGIDNLYVAGSGCYATSGAPNPTITLVALSLRLSDHVKDKLG